MILHIAFQKNIMVSDLLRQKHVPCICRIGAKFELIFREPLLDAVGEVEEWDRSLISERVPAGAGGAYTHYAYATVTLQGIDENRYVIEDLSVFNRVFGWCKVLENGSYSAPGDFWDKEE